MFEIIGHMFAAFAGTVAEMAPYLLFGFLVAGVLSVLVSAELVERHLGSGGIWPVVKAALFGVPLPLCSCGVIPVAASLRRHGAGRGATTAFLISTPQTGVDSILATFGLLGPVFAVFRPLAALVSGVFGGAMVGIIGGERSGGEQKQPECTDACCRFEGGRGKLARMLHYGFVTLPQDIGKSLLVGLAIAAVLSAVVPAELFAGRLGTGLTGMLVMMLCGIPIYVCATASIPVAAVLIGKGVSPGAALVFLMTGPATNAASITIIWRLMGARTTAVYLGSVALGALGSGALVDLIFEYPGVPRPAEMGTMIPGYVKYAAAVVLFAVLFFAIFRPRREEGSDDGADGEKTVLIVEGMTCSHCAETVRRALAASSGVESVSVDLSAGRAVVSGVGLDAARLSGAVSEVGYTGRPVNSGT